MTPLRAITLLLLLGLVASACSSAGQSQELGPIQGTTWEIDGFLSGGTTSTFETDAPGTIRIENGIMQLFDGCATVELPLDVDDTEIRFDPVGLPPTEDCDAPPGYRPSVYTAFSRGALAYTVDGANLTLATPDNVGFTLNASE